MSEKGIVKNKKKKKKKLSKVEILNRECQKFWIKNKARK